LLKNLHTARCELRPVSAADIPQLHELWITAGVRRFLWDDEIIPRQRAAEVVATSRTLFDRYGFGLWAIRQRQSPAIQGFAGIWPFRNPPEFELLFGIAEPLWGQGYAVEAAQAVLAYCASVIEMPVVRASTDVGNAASIRVLHKLGFTETQRATVDGLDTIFFERGSMPFKSKAQRRKFAQLLVEGKIKPETYEEWNRETGYRELPERVKTKTAKTAKPAARKKRAKTRAKKKR
jgi:RimJ/RimL family protein N-acetyltransferase